MLRCAPSVNSLAKIKTSNMGLLTVRKKDMEQLIFSTSATFAAM